jgi:hypothetical protein
MRAVFAVVLLVSCAGSVALAQPTEPAPSPPQPEVDADSDSDADTDSDSDSDADSDSDSDADADSESNTESDVDANPYAGAHPDADSDSDADGAAAGGPHWTEERVIAWTVFAASFGVAVLGGVLLAVGIDDVNTIENAPDGTIWADVAGARDRAPWMTGFGAGILVLGAAGLCAGAALLAIFGSGGTWLSVSALPGGVSLTGTF